MTYRAMNLSEQRFSLPTGQEHRICVARERLHLLELGPGCFGPGGAILMPTPRRSPIPGRQRGGVPHLVAALLAAEAAPGAPLVVAGHGPSGARDRLGAPLSGSRARLLALLLRGELEAWGAACAEVAEGGDLQHALIWAAARHGLDCHPGPLDGQAGPRTLAALTRFRREMADPDGAALEDAPTQTGADWAALGRCYLRAVARSLGEASEEGVMRRLAALFWASPDHIDCGLACPSEAGGPWERVDLVRFDAGRHGELLTPAPGRSAYGPWNIRSFGEAAPEPLVVVQLLGPGGVGVPDVAFEVTFADGSVAEGRLGRAGCAPLHDPPPGALKVAYPEGGDVRIKARAAALRSALEAQEGDALLRFLGAPPAFVAAVAAAFGALYPEVAGGDLLEAIEEALAEDPEPRGVDYLLAGHGRRPGLTLWAGGEGGYAPGAGGDGQGRARGLSDPARGVA